MKTLIEGMIYADSEQSFNSNMNQVKTLVDPTNHKLLKYVSHLGSIRHSFAKYLIQDFLGGRLQISSNPAEQNNWSVLSYITGGSNAAKRYKSSVHYYVKELLSRQSRMVNMLNQDLGESCSQRIMYKNKITVTEPQAGFSNEDITGILLPALDYMSFPSYELFRKECLLSKKYSCRDNEDGTVTVYYAEMDANHEGRILKKDDYEVRCNCKERKAFLMMCRHEVCLYMQFIPDLFHKYHRFRSQATRSINIGSWKNKSFSLFDSFDQSSLARDEFGGDEVLEVDEYSQFTQNGPDEIEAMDEDEMTHAAAGTTSLSKIPYKEQQALMQSLLGYSRNHNETTQQLFNALNLQLKTRMQEKPTEKETKRLQAQLRTCLACLCDTDTNSRASRQMAVPIIGPNAINRLKSSSDIRHARSAVVSSTVGKSKSTGAVMLSQTAPKSCSFCKSHDHNIQRCATKAGLGTVKTYADFHSLVQSSSPYRYLDENEVVEKYLPEGTFFFVFWV